jgi:hypothetical protein
MRTYSAPSAFVETFESGGRINEFISSYHWVQAGHSGSFPVLCIENSGDAVARIESYAYSGHATSSNGCAGHENINGVTEIRPFASCVPVFHQTTGEFFDEIAPPLPSSSSSISVHLVINGVSYDRTYSTSTDQRSGVNARVSGSNSKSLTDTTRTTTSARVS